jgi:hypothetical protein
MADAAAVVREYLQGKTQRNENDRARAVVTAATGEIVEVMPDGFTAKDIRTCVGTLLEGNGDTADMTVNARGRAVTTALASLVSDGQLTLTDKEYRHTDPTISQPRSIPVGL